MNIYTDIFTNPAKIFEQTYKSLEDIKETCLFMIDTNVLLLPYTIGSKELNEIERIYRLLLDNNRLFISAQVVKEFAKNRPTKLEEMFKSLSDHLSRVKDLAMPRYPMLGNLPEYEKIINLQNECNEITKNYKKEVKKVMSYIQSLNWNDPVSIIYSKLFKSNFVIENNWNFKDVKNELEERLRFNIPPAYKDKGKEDGGIGDYIIWKDILKLGIDKKQDVVFVTGDEKADWFHQSMGTKIYPRFELVHEYKESTQGNDLHLISLSELVELFGTDSATIETIRSAERVSRHRRFSSELRKQAILKAGSKCQLCHIEGSFDETNETSFLEIHHIRPLSKGGENALENIVVLCPNCHKIVHDRLRKDPDFDSGSPCQMSGQICPVCKVGIVDVTYNQDGIECKICGFSLDA